MQQNYATSNLNYATSTAKSIEILMNSSKTKRGHCTWNLCKSTQETEHRLVMTPADDCREIDILV